MYFSDYYWSDTRLNGSLVNSNTYFDLAFQNREKLKKEMPFN